MIKTLVRQLCHYTDITITLSFKKASKRAFSCLGKDENLFVQEKVLINAKPFHFQKQMLKSLIKMEK